MKEDKLIRGDAKLKKLPEDRQTEIFDRLNKSGETLASVRSWLREDGLSTSSRALSEFRDWYELKVTFKETEQDTLNFLELARKEMPDISEEEIARLGNLHFNLSAIKQRDPKLFLKFQTARHRAEMDVRKFDQRERELALSRDKFEFDAAKACLAQLPQLKVIAGNSKLSESDKINAIRTKLFGVLPEAGTDFTKK
jgi:hypothetical protein